MALLPSEEQETISLTALSSVCCQLPSGEPLPKPEGKALRDWVSQTVVSWSRRFVKSEVWGDDSVGEVVNMQA